MPDFPSLIRLIPDLSGALHPLDHLQRFVTPVQPVQTVRPFKVERRFRVVGGAAMAVFVERGERCRVLIRLEEEEEEGLESR